MSWPNSHTGTAPSESHNMSASLHVQIGSLWTCKILWLWTGVVSLQDVLGAGTKFNMKSWAKILPGYASIMWPHYPLTKSFLWKTAGYIQRMTCITLLSSRTKDNGSNSISGFPTQKGYLLGSQNEGEIPQLLRKHVGLLNQENNPT
jgi:hypothetical protein